MVLQKWHWLLGIPQPMTAEDLLLERNRRLDRYNNRPPIKKLAQDSPENNYNICGLTNKDVWKVNITTKKTGEYTFFTNFQHKVFLESLPSYRQSANIPSKLPKIPYLRPSQPLATSTTNNPYQQNNDTNKHKSSTSDSVKLVNLKFENAKPSNRLTKSNTQLKIQRPDHIQIQPHQTLYQIQDQITGCERRLRSRSSSSKEEKGLKLKKGKEVVVVFKGCDSANCSSLDDINKLEFEQELMGNLQQKSSEGSYRPRGKYTTTSSDERFFKKPVVEKKKYFEKSANLQGTKMIADCNHILKRVITDTVEQHVQSDNYCSYDERLYSTTCRAIVERPSKSKTIPEGMKRRSELFNPNYNFDKRKSGKKSEKSGSIIESIREKVMQYKEVNDSDSDLSYEWHKNSAHTRFPKETRTAVAVMMANQRSSGTHRCNLKNSETQTSPAVSVARAGGPVYRVPKSYRKIPCPKNLLCERGLHVGRCGRVVNKGNHLYFKREVRTIESLSTVNSMQNELVLATVSQEPFQKIMEPTSEKKDMVVELASGDNDYLSSPSPVESSTDSTIQTITPTMNGMNGHTNGELNGCGDIITQNQQKGCWTIGLINSKYRYLTAETFGFKINANGTSLKKKQIWTLEPDMSNSGDSLIYLRSHLQKYLAVDSFGNVTCESDEKDPGCKFQISVAEDGSGRWALRNVVRGYFLGSSSDKLTCTAKVPSDAELWHVHLAARPQVNLRSVGRKRFAHLSENLDEIHVDANVPWGEDTLFTLEFRLEESGKYAIHTCNNKYLSLGGKLVDNCTKDCLFSAEYHSGQLALRDRNGAYLSPIGSKAVLKTRSQTVTKDELFSLEDSLPQASFVAALNNKFVSVKQGVDVTANQDEISDHETFQLEFDWNTKRWYIRTMQDRYWTLETGGGIQAAGDKRSSNALFDLVWQDDGSVAFRANNGRYVITKRSGHLYATSDTVDENCKYFFYLVNRPILVLKCEQGFVGHKSANNTKLECNKATYETIQVERAEKGVVYFKGTNGKYWHVDSEGVTADTDTPEGFYLELREPTRLCIKSVSGNYLTASKNGCFRLGDSSVESATQWEY